MTKKEIKNELKKIRDFLCRRIDNDTCQFCEQTGRQIREEMDLIINKLYK